MMPSGAAGMERCGGGVERKGTRSECRGRRGVLGSWTSGKKVWASERSKQVNQRHAAQNGRYPILSISATQRPVSFMFSSFVGARGGQSRAFV